MSSKGPDDAIARAFYVERFDDFLALEQGASVQTSKAYKLDIARFVTYVSVKGAASASEVGTRAARVRLPPEGPGTRTGFDPQKCLGGAQLLQVSPRRRPRRQRSE